jgi:hypothetical protein
VGGHTIIFGVKQNHLVQCLRLTPILYSALLFTAAGESAEQDSDPWAPLRFFEGQWEGESQGQPGIGKTSREYRFVLNDRFLQINNKSIYPPQEKNLKGEIHEDIAFFSYDKIAKKLMLRQFHIEGFVNQFALDSLSRDGRTIVFVTTSIENISSGWRARETYRVIQKNEFIETFDLAEPGKSFATYLVIHFRRTK